jgi:hypothetical protein
MPNSSLLATRCARDVLRPHGSGEAKLRVVGDADRVRLAVEGHHDGDWFEHFILSDFRTRIDVIQHGRLDEKALLQVGRHAAAH